MRPQENPLDLNNLPDELSRDGKQVLQDSSSSGCRKKKSGVKDGKDECGKVYECRFCSLKFCKSQALGGHMNRHRQERETETLNHARELVFRNDHTLTTQGAPYLGCCQPIGTGSYHPASNMGEARFPRYMSSASSSIHMPPQAASPPPFLYTSASRPLNCSMKDFYVGHVLSGSQQQQQQHGHYTCMGAPVGQALGKDRSLHNHQEKGLNWGRSYSGTQHDRLDPPSAINRFQDGF